MYNQAMKILDNIMAQVSFGIGLLILLWAAFNGIVWLMVVASVVVLIDMVAMVPHFWLIWQRQSSRKGQQANSHSESDQTHAMWACVWSLFACVLAFSHSTSHLRRRTCYLLTWHVLLRVIQTQQSHHSFLAGGRVIFHQERSSSATSIGVALLLAGVPRVLGLASVSRLTSAPNGPNAEHDGISRPCSHMYVRARDTYI